MFERDKINMPQVEFQNFKNDKSTKIDDWVYIIYAVINGLSPLTVFGTVVGILVWSCTIANAAELRTAAIATFSSVAKAAIDGKKRQQIDEDPHYRHAGRITPGPGYRNHYSHEITSPNTSQGYGSGIPSSLPRDNDEYDQAA
jgi:hypothetical protein